MAALDFPASPTNGQIFTSNGSSWVYDSTKVAWRSSPYEPGAAITSATAPTTPQNGDIWFNTNDGTLYTYYNDGTTAQWVEVRSEIATSQVGLAPIAPSSVTVGSGSASVATNGLVTVSASVSVSLNNVFSSTYKNYRVIFKGAGSSLGAGINMRFRKAGTDSASSSFFWSGAYSRSTGSVGPWCAHGQAYLDMGRLHTNTTDQKGSIVMDILGPANAQAPMYSFNWAGEDPTSPLGGNGNGTYALNDTFDGITIFVGSGITFTGTLKVYGYN